MRLPPTFFLLSCISSPGFQLCSHFSLGKEPSATATHTKAVTGYFASSAQQRLRSFKAKEDTILCLHPMISPCPNISLSRLALPLSDRTPQHLSPYHYPQPRRPHSVPATKVWVPLGQRATLMSELLVLNAASGIRLCPRTVCCISTLGNEKAHFPHL